MLMTASAGGKHFRSGGAAVGAEAGALLVSEEFCICPVERAFIAPVNNVLWIFLNENIHTYSTYIYHDVEKREKPVFCEVANELDCVGLIRGGGCCCRGAEAVP